MKVGVDTSAAFAGPAGARTYLLELLPELIRQMSEQDELLVLHSSRKPPPEPIAWMLRGPRLRSVPLPLHGNRLDHLWRRLSFPPVELTGGAAGALRDLDVCHSVHPPLLPTGVTRRILTVQAVDQGADREPRERRALERSARRAELVITPSQRTREGLVEDLRVDPERILVIPPGVHRRFLEPPKPPVVESLFESYPFLQEPYLLALGSATERRKNFPFLIEAYALARHRQPDLAPLLVVAGAGDSAAASDEVARRDLEGKVLLLEGLESEALPALYRGAELLLYPAFDNAFGQGLLEAAACGVPGVADPSCGVLEILSEGVFRPPATPPAWAEEIVRLHRNPELRRRSGETARASAEGFTWEESARQHWEAYRR